MNFQKKFITTALGLAALGVSAESLAFDMQTSRAVDDNRFYISGATAMTDSMENLLGDADNAQNPCLVDAGWNRYTAVNGASAGLPSDVFIWACTARITTPDPLGGADIVNDFNNSLGITAGELIEFHKVDTGSGDGVRPFDPAWQPSGANGAYRNISFMDTTLVGTSCRTPAVFDVNGVEITPAGAFGTIPGGAEIECINMATDDTRTVVNGLTMGTSDVEAALFNSVNPAGSATGGSIIWGLPVSIDFRDALQANQFPTTSECHPTNGLYNADSGILDLNGGIVSNRESEACQPTLSRQIVNSLYTGQLDRGAKIMNTDGVSLFTSAAQAGVSPRGNDDAIRVCRRREGSGTEASYEAMYMKQRCMTGISTMLGPDIGTLADGADPYANTICPGDGVGAGCGLPTGDLFDPALRTFAGRGTGDVRECLTLHSQDPNNSNGDGLWAIGIFSSENVADDTATSAVSGFPDLFSRRYRHIKVDGYMPSTYNAAMGLYPYFSEYTMQTFLTADFGANEALPEVMTEARRQLVVAGLSNTLSDPQTLSTINGGSIHPWGQGGIMSPMNATTGRVYGFAEYPLNAVEVAANPLIPLIKHPLGPTSVNNCQEPVLENGTSLTFIMSNPVPRNNSNTTTDAELNQQ